MLNVRIGYITYPYPDIRASGLRHYPADSHLIAWLEAKGYEVDLITDWMNNGVIGIDVVALLIGVGLFLWLQPRDGQAAVMALVSALVFGGFFNVVVALVSIRP